MTTNSITVRFTINFAKKEITGSKASFKKAGKGFGPEYEELADKIAKFPTYKLVEVEPKKRSNKKKETYEGLNEDFMKNYITTLDDSEKYLAELNEVKKKADEMGKSVYPLMKKWFLKSFSDKDNKFDMRKAKERISDYLIDTARSDDKADRESETESKSAEQAAEKKAEIININEAPALADVV